MGASGRDEIRFDRATSPSLADWAAQEKAKEEAAKIVNLADMRARLRPLATIAAER
jgi:hypothetical protein